MYSFHDFEVKAFLMFCVKMTTLHYALWFAGSHDPVSKIGHATLVLLMENHARRMGFRSQPSKETSTTQEVKPK